MLLPKIFLVCVVSLVSLPIISLKVHAEGISDSQSQSDISVTQNQRQSEDLYTDRQKLLANSVRKIAHSYYQKTGIPIPVNPQSIKIVMNTLGAVSQEKSFVKEQMITSNNALTNIIRLNALIQRTQNFLRLLER